VGPNGNATCTNGTCGIFCNIGSNNCDGSLATGCEVNSASDPLNCGVCNFQCPVPPHTTVMCISGLCQMPVCLAGWGDCHTLSLGCESDLANDPQHCGSCGTACPKPANTVAHCASNTCGAPTCTANYGNCDGDLLGNGCETHLNSNQNCGSCGNNCTSGKHCSSNSPYQCIN
jgi:hypothetical protein